MFNAHLSLCSLPLFLSPCLANLSPNDKRNATTAPKLNLLPTYRCCEEPTNGQDGSQHCRCEERLQEHLQHLLTNTDTPTNCIRDALGADADNTDRLGDADDEWGKTWSLKEGSLMGADAVS